MERLSATEVAQFRKETPGTEQLIHFNNAGSSLPATPVLEAITGYLQQEAILGGYEAETRYQKELSDTYSVIAQLIGAQAEEIALVENASTGWCIAFHSIAFEPGDEVLISEFEYVTNMIGYLYGEKRYGIKLKVIPNDEGGNFSIAALEAAITSRTRLIAVTHVASGTGGVLPVEQIGAVARKHGIFYLLDACQSIGQLPVNVEAIQCDFLSVTGRKYLRAPRGTGFLYVRKAKQDSLNPLLIDGHATTFINREHYTLRTDARRFEMYEKSRALTLGLAKAVEYVLSIGIERIAERINLLATSLRQKLQAIEGVSVHDSGAKQCGIVTFTVSGYDSQQIKAHLAAHNINVSVGFAHSTLLYMNKQQLTSVVRASVHYYNTEEEIARFEEVFLDLLR